MQPRPLPDLLRELSALVPAGSAAAAALTPLRSAVQRAERDRAASASEAARSRLLLDRTLRVTLAEGLRPVSEELLDAVLTVVGATRGFVGVVQGTTWSFAAARNVDHADLADPERLISTTIVSRALAENAPVVTADAQNDAPTDSVLRMELRSVACFPLRHAGRTLGFVYLDDPETTGLFDEVAIAAIQAWLPAIGAHLARAAQAGPSPLPGVLSRSPVMLAVLEDLARVAVFDAPILLYGETGTGKSLAARAVHARSSRAAGPLIHLNCGAIPEALLEAEIFGAEAGAYTGAKARRIGKLEAARGGTLFLDELDTLPPSCQVKLLVALQERQITRLGANTPIDVDARLIAAMSSDPATAIAAGRLREDLYYRLAVFVARIPALRERREDIPLLAAHVLERTRARYGLPALRLSPAAEQQLQDHGWPGNVRELENALDRAALLARDGLIEALVPAAPALRVTPAPTAASALSPSDAQGPVAAVRRAAVALVEVMIAREDLRDLDLARALRGAVLEELIGRQGLEGTFRFLGRAAELKSRNHHRTVERELGYLAELQRVDPSAPGPASGVTGVST